MGIHVAPLHFQRAALGPHQLETEPLVQGHDSCVVRRDNELNLFQPTHRTGQRKHSMKELLAQPCTSIRWHDIHPMQARFMPSLRAVLACNRDDPHKGRVECSQDHISRFDGSVGQALSHCIRIGRRIILECGDECIRICGEADLLQPEKGLGITLVEGPGL